jgi:ketosteroid isomerase-like protein
MTARTPEDLDRLFAERLNAGDVEALVALYEPQAALTPPGGKSPVIGHAAIREVLAGFIAGKPRMTLMPRLLSQAGELALISAHWSVSMSGPDGKPMDANGQSVEVARRQPNGDWLFIMDVPGGTA